jgi:hypothetical protein
VPRKVGIAVGALTVIILVEYDTNARTWILGVYY